MHTDSSHDPGQSSQPFVPQIYLPFTPLGLQLSQVCSARCYCRTSVTTLLHSQPFTHSTSRDPGCVLPVVDHVYFGHRPESHHAQPRGCSTIFTTTDSTADIPHPHWQADRSRAQPALRCAQQCCCCRTSVTTLSLVSLSLLTRVVTGSHACAC